MRGINRNCWFSIIYQLGVNGEPTNKKPCLLLVEKLNG